MTTNVIESPVFILGCGRSGTTILGNVLAQHSRVTYLNEPRTLWIAAYPETDIWSGQAAARRGRLLFTESDHEPAKTQTLKALFALEVQRAGRPLLVEKLPINNFRLPFIRAMFPDCRFIHIWRNGVEVARSIEALCFQGEWFGSNRYKWDQLVRYARSMPETAELPELCGSYYGMGLLEWRLSTEAATRFLEGLPPGHWVELSYASFMADPLGASTRILETLRLPPEPTVRDFVRGNVRRRSESHDGLALTPLDRLIGGRLLELSVRPLRATLTAAAAQPCHSPTSQERA